MHLLLCVIDTTLSVKSKCIRICLDYFCLCNLKRNKSMPIFELIKSETRK